MRWIDVTLHCKRAPSRGKCSKVFLDWISPEQKELRPLCIKRQTACAVDSKGIRQNQTVGSRPYVDSQRSAVQRVATETGIEMPGTASERCKPPRISTAEPVANEHLQRWTSHRPWMASASRRESQRSKLLASQSTPVMCEIDFVQAHHSS